MAERSRDLQQRLKKILGKALERFRLEKKLGVEQMARKIGISRVSLGRIESGEQLPRLSVIYALCHHFDLQFEDILPPISALYPENLNKNVSIDDLEEDMLKQELRKAQQGDV